MDDAYFNEYIFPTILIHGLMFQYIKAIISTPFLKTQCKVWGGLSREQNMSAPVNVN
jgi:phospholipase/lecithinase/hemolysin